MHLLGCKKIADNPKGEGRDWYQTADIYSFSSLSSVFFGNAANIQ